jgi:AcrR family transcriptional regulator
MKTTPVRKSVPSPDPRRSAAAARAPDRGSLTRRQLIAHATRIFATKGYAATSTREICQAAGANVAAIHYYFGDKEALYRAVLAEPIRALTEQFGSFDDPSLPFEDAIRRVLEPFVVMALVDDPEAPHVERLHLREALEPSAVFRDVVARVIAPQHDALASLLARHCGLARPDIAIQQLAFALVAMANDYCVSREFIKLLAPEVLERRDAARQIVERLVGYAGALLAHEKARRAAPLPTPRSPSRRAARTHPAGASR